MKKIYKDFNNPPNVLNSPQAKALLHNALIEKGTHDFKTGIYRHPAVLEALSSPTLYNNKCAFCESDTTAGAPMQVEHYRPKAKVSEDDSHPGYYWLGYEWTNLLLACSSCNNKKRNHFPIAIGSARVKSHPVTSGILDTALSKADSQMLVDEQALLINPELENETRSYFSFSSDGKIKGNNLKGETTINICGLNRNPLLLSRKKIYDDLFGKLLRHLDRYNRQMIDEDTLLYTLMDAICNLIVHIERNGVYFEFVRSCLVNFEDFFIKRFQPPEARLLMNAYQRIKTEYYSL